MSDDIDVAEWLDEAEWLLWLLALEPDPEIRGWAWAPFAPEARPGTSR